MRVKETIFDPLRKKDVPLTPEEEVRQWFIGVLRDNMDVPVHMMMSEVPMKVATPSGIKPYRADIVVYSREAAPLMVVECKRPSVVLSRETALQALRYASLMEVDWIAITNGPVTFAFRKEDGVFKAVDTLPKYLEMNGK